MRLFIYTFTLSFRCFFDQHSREEWVGAGYKRFKGLLCDLSLLSLMLPHMCSSWDSCCCLPLMPMVSQLILPPLLLLVLLPLSLLLPWPPLSLPPLLIIPPLIPAPTAHGPLLPLMPLTLTLCTQHHGG